MTPSELGWYWIKRNDQDSLEVCLWDGKHFQSIITPEDPVLPNEVKAWEYVKPPLSL